MQSVTSLYFYNSGRQVGDPWDYNTLSSNPGIGNVWDEVIDFLGDLFDAWVNDDKDAGERAKAELQDLLKGKDVKVGSKAQVSLNQGDRVPGVNTAVDTVRVVFLAWSDDDITESFGVARQPGAGQVVRDGGDRRWKDGDLNVYQHDFYMPLFSVPVGTYDFLFGSSDDGWYYDVAVASLVTVTIGPRSKIISVGGLPTELLMTLSPDEIDHRIAAKGQHESHEPTVAHMHSILAPHFATIEADLFEHTVPPVN